MVQLVPPSADADTPANANANPTQADIDAYIHGGYGSAAACVETLRGIAREIECKSGAGALLHPAEEYFAAQCSSLL
jgi:hypothetical protein